MNRRTKVFVDEKKIPYLVVPGTGHFMTDDNSDDFYDMLFESLCDSGTLAAEGMVKDE